ncbi:integrase [Segetibacter aerophilus]|uniref:Integrase n=2 Tax=Segetibacter aerophilus TaxID=670293 RepID=A0A512B8H7_9BACT|nr:integrase [Segetibacter aerophilus]
MLTVNLQAKQFRISLKLRSTKEDFDKAISSARALNTETKFLRTEINEYVTKAETILERLINPSQESFSRLFKSNTDLLTSTKTSITPFFQMKILELHKEERFSQKVNSKLALSSLLKYKAVIYFEEIDVKFLKGYTEFMVNSGKTITTANFYLRALRTVFADVVKSGIVAEKYFPFRGYIMSSRVRSKSVLYPEQLKALLNYPTVGKRETRAKAYFFFCYLTNGCNFRDVAMLKWKNVQGNMIIFVRHKTRHTTQSEKEIKVYMHDLSKEIIKKWGNVSTKPDEYIFPVCKKGMTEEQMNKAIIRYKRISNKFLAPIGKKLGFEVHLCLNLARHSFATKMKIDGVAVTAISDALGHTTTTTTEHYMKSLPDEYIKEMSSNLLKFAPADKLLVI